MSDAPSGSRHPVRHPSSEWCRAILDNTRDVVSVLDRELAIHYKSPSVEEVLGYAPDELLGHKATELAHPDDRPALDEALEALMRDPSRRASLEVRFRHRDGSWRTLDMVGRNLIDHPEIRGILVNSRDITKRRRAEEALGERERAFSSLLRDLPGMVYRCVIDPDWETSFVSAGAQELTGHSPAALAAGEVRFSDLIHSDDRERVQEELRTAIRTREPYSVEYRLHTSRGEEKWVRDQGRPVFTEAGEFLTLEGIVTDITARQLAEERARELARAEAARQEAEEAGARIRAIVESIKDGFVVVDREWRVTYVNRRAAAMGRRRPEELLGQNILEAYPDAPAAHVANLTRAMEERVPVHYEIYYAPFDLWAEVHAYPSHEGLTIYSYDITERKRAEEALRESEERFRQMAENVGEVFWMFTPDFSRTLYVNAAYQRVFGAPPEALYRNPTDFLNRVHAEDRERVLAVMERVAHEEITVHMRVIHPDGEVRWTIARGFPVRDEDGVVVRITGVTRDVTERERMQLELRRQHSLLETILEGVPDLVFLKDVEGRYRHVNSAAIRLLGRPREAILGATDEVLFPPELARHIRKCDRAVTTSGQPLKVEERIPHAEGERDFDVVKVPFRDEQGAVTGVIGIARDITERKRMEATLRESEERHRKLFQDAPIPMWLFDSEGLRFVEVNEAAIRRYGYSREEFLSLTLADIRPREALPEFSAAVDQIKGDSGYAHVRRMKHLNRSGERLTVDVYAHRIMFGGRRLWMASIIDVTEQVRAEMELRESEERFRQLAENVAAVFWMFSADLKHTIYVSPRYDEVWGGGRDRVLKDPLCCPEAALPEDRERLLTELRNMREGPRTVEFRIRRADGEVRWVECNGFPIRNEAGEVYRVAGLTEDITLRKQAEEALQRKSEMVRLLQVAAVAANESGELEHALHTVMDQVCRLIRLPVGHVRMKRGESEGDRPWLHIWSLSEEARFTDFRRATEALDHEERESLLGQVAATCEPAWIEDLARSSTYPRAEAARRAGLHAGIAFPVLVGGDVVAVMEFFSEEPLLPDDLLLEAMGNVGAQLGRVVERRRAGEALQAAKEEAERANRAKSEFLSRMSHELRTPMNAILGFAQVLEMDLVGEENRESVQHILRAGHHLLRLIDEVLDLARIEAERISLSLEPVSIAGVVGESLDLVRAMAAERDLMIHTLRCDHFAQGDQQRLKQVILNLLSNAVKYNRPGGTVTVWCEQIKGDRVRINVSDTGPGLTAEQRTRVFTPFDRLGAESTGIPGTGLGLSLSRGLVQAMGGTLEVDSTPGQGSTFWIELPRALSIIGEEEPQLPEAAREASSAARRTVLYVEDNLSNLRLIERVLARRPDITLIPAMQGRLGLDLAHEHRPDLILLDVHLPDINGHEVLTEIRRDPHLKQVPVVVISADATPSQIERMREAGAREYLTKPIDIARFLEVVEATLGSEEPGS